MIFTNFVDDHKEPEKKVVKESIKTSSPRNFKSYIKKINSLPVIVMCNENEELVKECKKLSIKYHVIREKFYVEDKGDRVLIKDMFDQEGYISVNKKNTIVLESEAKIVTRLQTSGLKVLSEKQIKEKLNASS